MSASHPSSITDDEMSQKDRIDADQARAIIADAVTREGGFHAEVAALSVCVEALEAVDALARSRVLDHLRAMFPRIDSMELLLTLAEEHVKLVGGNRA